MAGIGFVLRNLTRQDNLFGVVRGFAHSMIASNGPWLFTILSLGTVTVLGAKALDSQMLTEFRLIIIYNFSMSLVMSGPVLMVVTRTLADLIFEKDMVRAIGVLMGAALLMLATQLPAAIYLYLFYADLAAPMQFAAITNFLLIGGLWLVCVFLSALKDYRAISSAFALGMAVAAVAGGLLAEPFGTVGMLFGFNAGIGLIFGILLAKILAEYPYRPTQPCWLLANFRVYWLLALSGLSYNIAIWIDKWIMWQAPEAERVASGLVSYPHYDSAMFLSHLTVVPAMAVFMIVVETSFYEAYLKYYRDIQRHANLNDIRENHRVLVRVLARGVRNLAVLQTSLAGFIILLSPQIFTLLGLDFIQIGIFRLGVFGSLFQVLVLVLFIVLWYFDLRKPVLLLQLLFLSTNALFTWLAMQWGHEWYGYGFFCSALVTFLATYLVISFYVSELPYQSFVRNNAAVVR